MYGELDGLLGSDANELGHKTAVESEDAFVADDFLETVHRVTIHELADE